MRHAPLIMVSRETMRKGDVHMHARIDSNIAVNSVVWHINDSLARDGITVDAIDCWLDTDEADKLPNWAWDIINTIAINVTDCEG